MPHWTDYHSEAELRAALIANARSYVGVRYRHQQSTRELGVDCAGLLIAQGRDFQFEFTLRENDQRYSFDPNGYYLVERLREEMHHLPDWRQAQPADIIVMRWHINRPPQHVGILTLNVPDNVTCVHSSRFMRRVSETRWDREDLITDAFCIRELA